MSEVTITAKIKLLPDKEIQASLLASMEQYRLACNFIADNISENHSLNQNSVHKAVYTDVRSLFGLTAQMTCSAVRTVIAKYKTIQANLKRKPKVQKGKIVDQWDVKPDFKQPQCDLLFGSKRDYGFLKGNDGIFSISTVNGRVEVPFVKNGIEHYFDKSKYKFGTAHLTQIRGKFYLLVSVTETVEECKPEEVKNIVGIDRGIRFIATSYDSDKKTRFFSGSEVKQKRAKFNVLRQKLQKRGTSSARRRLKAIGQRENRWMSAVNHCVTKTLVEQYPSKTLFVLEDLSGIRGATERVKRKDRYVQVSWSYYDLEKKLKYKAERNGSKMTKVSAKYTSQCCPVCGHVQKSNRDSKLHCFCCKHCGYRSNDDRIGAMNLYRLGLDWIKNPVKNPEKTIKITKIDRNKLSVDGVESRTPRCNATACSNEQEEKGRRCKTVCTTGQLQVLCQSSTTLCTP